MGIRKVKTWHGLRWGVVDAKGDVIEYRPKGMYPKLAIFEYTAYGLNQARKLLKALKK